MSITFRDLSYWVPLKGGKKKIPKEKKILKDITGVLRPGRFTVILGASGAGKTSLLNVLSGEARSGVMGGQILINGQEVKSKEVKELAGFVQQDDVILDTMTVREVVTMSALLRLPPSISRQKKLQRVEEILELMQLTGAADTIIGNPQVKGVSGGERKRTSISMELVTNPSILFLDEPTSGLDTYTAYSVCHFLKDLASSGRTIVSTLHQPSSEIFQMIDDVILMADGQIMYAGPASQVVPYFGARGYLCPHYVNPADFLFMNVLNRAGGNSAGNASPGSVDLVADSTKRSRSSGSIEAAESLMEKGDASMTRSASTAPQDSAIIQYLLQEWIASDLGKAQDALARSGSESGVQGFDNAQKKYHSGFLTQFLVLIKRVWSNAWRNEAILRVKFLEVLFISFFTDAIFWKIPEKGLESQIQNRTGAIFFFIINPVFTYSTGNLMIFYQERLVFEREYGSGMYSLPAYFASKTLVEVPFMIILPLLMTLFTYFAIGLQTAADKFFICALGVILNAIFGGALGLFSSCTFRDIHIAHVFVPMILLPLMIFSGLFVNLGQVQPWIRWIQWISPMKYGYVALVKNELTGLEIGGVPGEQYYTQLGLDNQGSIAVNLIACLGFCVLLWLAAYMGLWRLVASSRQSIKIRKQA